MIWLSEMPGPNRRMSKPTSRFLTALREQVLGVTIGTYTSMLLLLPLFSLSLHTTLIPFVLAKLSINAGRWCCGEFLLFFVYRCIGFVYWLGLFVCLFV